MEQVQDTLERIYQLRIHIRNIQEYSGHIQGTYRAHSGNIQGTFRAHSGNIQGTFS
jgi:hypothetical protein